MQQRLRCRLSRDILLNDRIDGAIFLEFLDRSIYLLKQLGVILGNRSRILLICVRGVQNLQALVCSDVVLGRLVVDDNTVNLAVNQRRNSERAVVKLLDKLLAVVVGAVQVARGTRLYADVLAFQIVRDAISEPSGTMMTWTPVA